MPAYEITSFRGGISDYEEKGTSGSFKHGKNLNIRKATDSLTCNQALVDEGLLSDQSPSASVSPSSSTSLSPSPSFSASASPTPSPSASQSPSSSVSSSPSPTKSNSLSSSPSPSGEYSSVFRDLIRFFVKGSDGYTYGFGSTGYVYRRDSDAFWQILYKDPDGEIKGAAEWYSISGKTYLYWANDRKLKRKELPGRGDWNDVSQIADNINSADWHTMRECGGSLIIANGPWLALVGYDDSYTNEALNLIPGNIAKTIVERKGRTIVGTGRKLDTTRSINGAIDTEVPLSQVGDNGEIYYADGANFVPAKTLAGGGKVNPGGVCSEIEQVNFFEWTQTALSWVDKQTIGNMALFAIYGASEGYGGIYSYGRRNKNHPFVLNLEYAFDADELGAIASVNGTIIVSYREGTTFGVKAVSSSSKAQAVYEGLDFRSPIKKPVNVTNYKYAEIDCKPLPDGSSIEFWYRMNKSGAFVQAKMQGGSSTFQARDETKAIFLIGATGDVYEPRAVINPIGNLSPEIIKIKTFFD